ncbi:MAG: CoA transferase [Phascolarctobacterium sp.]|nr:CoA transferase [Phascolarctobacterium sp.]
MLALEGIRVLDMSRLLPGPYCTSILADFGAEVIKIEEPGKGDYSRTFPPFIGDLSYWFLIVNRNKKSVVINLKTEEGKKQFLELVKTADVVVESYRPGVLKKLGVDYEAASKINPKIVYCSLSGYGKQGPLSKQADHDIGYVSLAGITSMSGEQKPAIPGVLMADMTASYMAGMSIMIALRHAQATGQGQEIDVSLYNASMTLMPGVANLYFGSGFVAERGNNWLTGANPNYNIYETKDGRFMSVGCLEKKFWTNLCTAMGKDEFVNLIDDAKNYPYLREEMGKVFKTKTMREWESFLYGKDTCVTPVLKYDEACAAEQTKVNEMVLDVHDEDLGDYKLPGFAMKLSKTPASIRMRAPYLGEHNEEFLK